MFPVIYRKIISNICDFDQVSKSNKDEGPPAATTTSARVAKALLRKIS